MCIRDSDNVMPLDANGPREWFEAFARSVRDVLSQRWVRTEQTYDRQNPKRLYYLSMEFLVGRSLDNNITNLLLEPIARHAAAVKGIHRMELLEQEPVSYTHLRAHETPEHLVCRL